VVGDRGPALLIGIAKRICLRPPSSDDSRLIYSMITFHGTLHAR
jgi:hypothetical protein